MKFFDQVGKLGLGTRLRYLGEEFGKDAAQIYEMYGVDLHPKWFPVFYALSKSEAQTVTSIAEYIGHSHASVSKIINEMSKAGLLREKTDAKDRRRTLFSLSKKGRVLREKIEEQYIDVSSAVQELSSQATHNLWEALREWEYLLEQKSFLERVVQKKKRRESASVRIEPYRPKYHDAFRSLNEEWINLHFDIEDVDCKALYNPKKYILDRGGFIFVATIDKRPVGVCALQKREEESTYELAKMAVSPKERGKSIGFMLGKAVIEKAELLHAKRVYLESNTVLRPAIKLYEKLGFRKIVKPGTSYRRCNIQMELEL